MTFKFVCFVDKDEWESFLLGIAQVNLTPLIIFGPERISCNTMTTDESMMFSGMINHSKTSIQGELTFNVALDLPMIIASLASAPSGELALMFDGVLFYVEYDTASETHRLQFPIIQRHRLELPKYDYPLKFDIDSKHLEFIVSTLHEAQSIIFSREENGLLIADPTWETFTTIEDKDIQYTKNVKGNFSTMISTAMMLKAFEVLSLYESINIGLGEDIPLVLLGTSERLKMGFMIGPEVDEGS